MQALAGQFTAFSGLSCRSLPAQRPIASSPAARPGCHQPLTIQAAQLNRKEANQKRHRRIRNKVNGSTERPRLAVYRSNNHIYAQVIDDTAGNTLAAASTLTPDVRSQLGGALGANQEAAQLVGRKIAELCLSKSIEKVAFDRGGHVYHGRIKALADAAREGGLNF